MPPKVVIVNEVLDRLPIGEVLEWKPFEQFCTDVLASRMNIVDVREYLQQGNDQDGIDIYATESGINALTVAQCKLKTYTVMGKKDMFTSFLQAISFLSQESHYRHKSFHLPYLA
ncbi:hypothetical protein DBR11_20985 [Pedobacter sp. HMWF019]|nr:hypothetical protein DBR11_20985 [Pedobacter sp. HMWF019]